MIRSLRTGITGIQANQTRMDVIGNNIANVNTAAFKRGRAAFAELLGQQLVGVGRMGGGSSINPAEVGMGTAVASIDRNWNQGGFESTNIGTDLALNGEGFFIAREVGGNSRNILTRAGNFGFNNNGELVTANGLNVQGWRFADDGSLTTGAMQDVVIDVESGALPRETSQMTLSGNLSADASVFDTAPVDDDVNKASVFGLSFDIHDSQGKTQKVVMEGRKTGVNEWTILEAYIENGDTRVELNLNGVDVTSGPTRGEIEAVRAAAAVNATNVSTAETARNDARALQSNIDAAEAARIAARDAWVAEDPGNRAPGDPGAVAAGQAAYDASLDAAGSAAYNTSIQAAQQAAETVLRAANPLQGVTLEFDDKGNMTGPLDADGNLLMTMTGVGGATFANTEADDINLTVNMGGLSQNNGSTTAQFTEQDGQAAGTLEGYSIDSRGILTLNYSNGWQRPFFQLGIGDVANEQGLEQIGENFFAVTSASGDLLVGRAQQEINTSVVSGALELSNVDLAQEFTDMIVTQRGYQASARVITTSDELLQEVVQLKR